MAKTENIGLELTTDQKTKFKDWVKTINGEGTDENPSNAQIVDKAIGALSDSKQDKIDSENKLDYSLLANTPDIPEVPSDVSAFNNDAGYITQAVENLINYYTKSETYTQEEVNDLLGTIEKISFKKVTSVSEVTEAGYIYLVPSAKTEADNVCDEYIFIDDHAELIGSTKIDLSDYYTKEEIADEFETLSISIEDYNNPVAPVIVDSSIDGKPVYGKSLYVNTESYPDEFLEKYSEYIPDPSSWSSQPWFDYMIASGGGATPPWASTPTLYGAMSFYDTENNDYYNMISLQIPANLVDSANKLLYIPQKTADYINANSQREVPLERGWYRLKTALNYPISTILSATYEKYTGPAIAEFKFDYEMYQTMIIRSESTGAVTFGAKLPNLNEYLTSTLSIGIPFDGIGKAVVLRKNGEVVSLSEINLDTKYVKKTDFKFKNAIVSIDNTSIEEGLEITDAGKFKVKLDDEFTFNSKSDSIKLNIDDTAGDNILTYKKDIIGKVWPLEYTYTEGTKDYQQGYREIWLDPTKFSDVVFEELWNRYSTAYLVAWAEGSGFADTDRTWFNARGTSGGRRYLRLYVQNVEYQQDKSSSDGVRSIFHYDYYAVCETTNGRCALYSWDTDHNAPSNHGILDPIPLTPYIHKEEEGLIDNITRDMYGHIFAANNNTPKFLYTIPGLIYGYCPANIISSGGFSLSPKGQFSWVSKSDIASDFGLGYVKPDGRAGRVLTNGSTFKLNESSIYINTKCSETDIFTEEYLDLISEARGRAADITPYSNPTATGRDFVIEHEFIKAYYQITTGSQDYPYPFSAVIVSPELDAHIFMCTVDYNNDCELLVYFNKKAADWVNRDYPRGSKLHRGWYYIHNYNYWTSNWSAEEYNGPDIIELRYDNPDRPVYSNWNIEAGNSFSYQYLDDTKSYQSINKTININHTLVKLISFIDPFINTSDKEELVLSYKGNAVAAVPIVQSKGGADVIANPEDEATENLTKIKIDNVTYGLDFATKEDMTYLRGYIDYLGSLHEKTFINSVVYEDGTEVDKLKFVSTDGTESSVILDNHN